MKKRYYKDITIRVELSSVDEDRLNGLVQKLIGNLNTKTTKTIKYDRLLSRKEPTALDSFDVKIFPNR